MWTAFAQSVEYITYYSSDQVETPVVAIDHNAGVIATRRYSGYGSDIRSSGNQMAFGDIGYTGQIDRSNNKIVYFKARYYLPELKRFISPDPITVADGDYKHIDRYGYGYGNPVNANDPSGEIAETPWDIANAAIGWGTFAFDVSAGNWWGAAESGIGALYDTAAIFVPGLPGGASMLVKSGRVTKGLAGIPGRVQSRINLQTGTNKFGMKHILREHLSGKTNKSQFNLTEGGLRSLLQSKEIVGSPIVKTLQSKSHGTLYVRQVDVGRNIGTNYLKNNSPTSILTTQSDMYGNIITAFPGK